MKILFLCLGNICRSPMAEAIFQHMVNEAGLAGEVEVDSAGLGGWHAGEPPHAGTKTVLQNHGISFDWIRSRKIAPRDLKDFDYIVAMDAENVEGLRKLGPVEPNRVFRLLDLLPEVPEDDVPDPYYTGDFDGVYALIEPACRRLLERVTAKL